MEKKLKHRDVIKLVKRNEIKEIVEKTTAYFTKNTENVIIAAIIAAALIIGIPLFLKAGKANSEKAEQALARANNIFNAPVSNDAQMAMYGYFPGNQQKYETAASSYMEVIQGYRNTKAAAFAQLGLAASYFNNGKFGEAEEAYSLFIEKNAKHAMLAEAYNGLAYSRLEAGKLKEASEAWEKIVNELDKSAVIWEAAYNLASVYEMLGRKEDSKTLYTKTAAGDDAYYAAKAAAK